MKAVIIAAGCGSRLESQHKGMPKTLLKIGNRRVIDIILDGVLKSAINDVVIVTGFQAAALEEYLSSNVLDSLNIEFCYNASWKLSNGISVLSAEENIQPGEEFILLMSDHIFEPEMLKHIVETAIEPDQALLALDFKLEFIPDLDDGMKVQCDRTENGRLEITGLDKNYRDYQAIDCGMFKLNHSFFATLRNSIEQGRDSLSDACNSLAQNGKMIGVDIGDRRWIDLDTPEMFSFRGLISSITRLRDKP
ncbi:MAG: NTP transferase domain-containing protein [Candidatus Sabulitectum sp.]|nr:NTP transferase domain-containing protein [Candidatus Sabulitectum sp.]